MLFDPASPSLGAIERLVDTSPNNYVELQRPLTADSLALLAERCDTALLSQLLWASSHSRSVVD